MYLMRFLCFLDNASIFCLERSVLKFLLTDVAGLVPVEKNLSASSFTKDSQRICAFYENFYK